MRVRVKGSGLGVRNRVRGYALGVRGYGLGLRGYGSRMRERSRMTVRGRVPHFHLAPHIPHTHLSSTPMAA